MRTLHIALVVLLVAVGGYTAFEARPFLSGPELVVAPFQNSAMITNGIVTISGHTARAVALSVDGKKLIPNENGSFSRTVVLPRGVSILKIQAADRFGHTKTDTRMLFVH